MSDLIASHCKASELGAHNLGATILIGCYPPGEILHIEQLRVVRRTFVYTDEGFTDVAADTPVALIGGAS